MTSLRSTYEELYLGWKPGKESDAVPSGSERMDRQNKVQRSVHHPVDRFETRIGSAVLTVKMAMIKLKYKLFLPYLAIIGM